MSELSFMPRDIAEQWKKLKRADYAQVTGIAAQAMQGLAQAMQGAMPAQQESRVAQLESMVDRANSAALHAQEITFIHAQKRFELMQERDAQALRIRELETEVAALTETLRTLFKSAANPQAMPSDTSDFPTTALAHSWATKGTSR